MEEEDLGVGDGCGEQTRGAAASGADHRRRWGAPGAGRQQLHAEAEGTDAEYFFLPYFILLGHLIYLILLQGN